MSVGSKVHAYLLIGQANKNKHISHDRATTSRGSLLPASFACSSLVVGLFVFAGYSGATVDEATRMMLEDWQSMHSWKPEDLNHELSQTPSGLSRYSISSIGSG